MTDECALSPLSVIPPLSPDLAKYRPMLGTVELTDEQADALLLEIWGFMLKCVEAQFSLPSIPGMFAVLLKDGVEKSDPARDDQMQV